MRFSAVAFAALRMLALSPSLPPRAGSQRARVVMFLRHHGPVTDHAVAEGLDLPLATINGLRNQLLKSDQVRAYDHVPGVRGARRTRWTLTERS